jgi:hypothetical protein
MDALAEFFLGSPTGLALFGAHFLYFALFAWAVVAVRAVRRRMGRAELVVFAVFTAFILLEAVQLAVDGSFFAREAWGLPRYFGVFAPLLWLWLAKGLADLWTLKAPRAAAYALRAAIVLALAYVFAGENVWPVSDELLHGNGREALTAARNIAPVIRADYKGPRRQRKAVRQANNEYFQSRRPVVFGSFGAAAWAVRGQSEGAIQTVTRRGLSGKSLCPYPPDYVFLCLGREGESDFEVDLDEKKFAFVGGVRGMKTVWGLFRRK